MNYRDSKKSEEDPEQRVILHAAVEAYSQELCLAPPPPARFVVDDPDGPYKLGQRVLGWYHRGNVYIKAGMPLRTIAEVACHEVRHAFQDRAELFRGVKAEGDAERFVDRHKFADDFRNLLFDLLEHGARMAIFGDDPRRARYFLQSLDGRRPVFYRDAMIEVEKLEEFKPKVGGIFMDKIRLDRERNGLDHARLKLRRFSKSSASADLGALGNASAKYKKWLSARQSGGIEIAARR